MNQVWTTQVMSVIQVWTTHVFSTYSTTADVTQAELQRVSV